MRETLTKMWDNKKYLQSKIYKKKNNTVLWILLLLYHFIKFLNDSLAKGISNYFEILQRNVNLYIAASQAGTL